MKKGAVYAEVGEGEGLFIPEGWWHQITSSPGTVAVNVWFKVSAVIARARTSRRRHRRVHAFYPRSIWLVMAMRKHG